jgi:SpoVK/Ycf46/Vps4 family AAA+-type ATPase
MGATYANELAVQLSEKSIDLLFENDATHIKSRFKARDTKSHTDIPVKELFFEEKLQERIQFFSKALAQENFSAMQQRMTEKGLVKGLTAIFYGTPGTGKTESAYQIARQTGRDLYVVDASKTKSMWFGESEKVMRKLFESYRAQCKRSALTPILLFNEADAVLGARMENKKQSLDETVNAMKNILLEEMESFEGILIATTNLVGNMDKAFERRFMFKVEFTKPTAEALTQIWQSKMDWLQPDEIGTLVDRFAFSGGQIDNIVRKATLNEVLTGNRPTLIELLDYCVTENYSTKSGKRLGFN